MKNTKFGLNNIGMHKIAQSFIILLFSSFLMSCSSLLYTSIDVLMPAQLTFPSDIQHVAVINNTAKQPHTVGHTNDLFEGKSSNISIDTDSLPIFALASFVERMQETEFFNYVDFELNSRNETGSFNSISLLNQQTINIIQRNYQSDAVIVLNRLVVNDELGELYNQEEGSFISYLEARYEYNWSIHVKNQERAFSIITKDTVYWETENYSRKRSMQDMPNRRDALIDGALISGQRAVNQFIPYWNKEDRYLFKLSGQKFQVGLDALYRKDWDDAIKVWEGLLEKNKNAYAQARFAHNLSVLYEIKADMDKASLYINQAVELLDKNLFMDVNQVMIVLEQQEAISKRKEYQNKLNNQLGISN